MLALEACFLFPYLVLDGGEKGPIETNTAYRKGGGTSALSTSSFCAPRRGGQGL